MKLSTLSILIGIIFASTGFTHGVERGDKFNYLLDDEIQKRIFGMIEKSCDVRKIVSLEITDVAVSYEKVDHAEKDYFYTVTLKANMPDYSNEEHIITVKAAEYSISNPTIDRYEVFSVKSQICD